MSQVEVAAAEAWARLLEGKRELFAVRDEQPLGDPELDVNHFLVSSLAEALMAAEVELARMAVIPRGRNLQGRVLAVYLRELRDLTPLLIRHGMLLAASREYLKQHNLIGGRRV